MWYLIGISLFMIIFIYNEIKVYNRYVEQWWIALPLVIKHEMVTKYLDKKEYIYQITDREKRFLYKQFNKG